MVAQSDARQPLETLDNAIQVTSDAIAAKAKDDTQRLGMGTTCACAWVIGNRLFTASVGDSRIYLLRNGSLMQLTVDHTWVQEAVERGILEPEDARNHPNVHVIRRYLGSSKTPQADTSHAAGQGRERYPIAFPSGTAPAPRRPAPALHRRPD